MARPRRSPKLLQLISQQNVASFRPHPRNPDVVAVAVVKKNENSTLQRPESQNQYKIPSTVCLSKYSSKDLVRSKRAQPTGTIELTAVVTSCGDRARHTRGTREEAAACCKLNTKIATGDDRRVQVCVCVCVRECECRLVGGWDGEAQVGCND